MTPNSAYQSGMSTPDMQARMSSYESNKDPFSNMRKGGPTEWTAAERTALSSELNGLVNDPFCSV